MATLEFSGELVWMGPGDTWVLLNLPKTASAKLPSRGRVSVVGTINGFSFRTSVFPTRDGTHQFNVNKEIRAGAKAGTGDRMQVVLEVDTEPRTVTVPADLRKALAGTPAASAAFEGLAPYHKKAYADWVAEAKRPETRAKRVTETIASVTSRDPRFWD